MSGCTKAFKSTPDIKLILNKIKLRMRETLKKHFSEFGVGKHT